MSIAKLGRQRSGTPPNADEYLRSFARQVHELLALGFARLQPRKLATQDEETITGQLVQQIRFVVADPNGPTWAWRYAIHDDPPVNVPRSGPKTKLATGRRRPRIDLVLEQCARGRPHPCFALEAKRLRDSGGASDYLGEDGLGALAAGYYGDAHQGLGMVGYVQVDDCEIWIERIEARLSTDRQTHGLAKTGRPWSPAANTGALRTTLISDHNGAGATTRVYHTLLKCC